MRATTWFLRLLGGVYVAAFVSLWTQIVPLLGTHGLLPVPAYLDAARDQLGAISYWLLPTALWLGAGDTALHVMCATGTVCGALALLGIAPLPTLAGAWLAYLSLVTVGQDFLRFQWDSLLLETGFVALLLAPRRWRSSLANDPAPSRAALWLGRWLLFRLMVSSALVKLTSGDPTWRSLTALDFHYFTQPLPPWTAWYMQQLPSAFQKLSVIAMFAIEGLAPFLIWGPLRVRVIGAALISGLQVLIFLTGNYGFFNLLSIALCVLLFAEHRPEPRRWTTWPVRIVAGGLVALSLVPLTGALGVRAPLGPLTAAYRFLSPLHLVNPYGLFAVMTTERREIVLEGSRDGLVWETYELPYKPGDVTRRPAFVAPHMPRLDWQLWFAALGDAGQNPWFLSLCRDLLMGQNATSLLARNPFPEAPPRYVRADVYLYRFTTPAERRATGAWWSRSMRRPYVPPLAVVDGRLVAARGVRAN